MSAASRDTRIAVVGAPGTGKSRLAQALMQARPALRVADAPAPSSTHARGYAHTLLMGLDLPGGNAASTADADAQLRHALETQGIAYAVVYGQGEERLRNALRLIEPEPERPVKWKWTCEKCSDPDCEHRLFSAGVVRPR